MYTELKDRNPKLFYIQVLEEIAKDLNEKIGDCWYEIYYSIDNGCYRMEPCYSTHNGLVKFSSYTTAQKAIEIMGDKLDLIFKQ